MRLEGLDSAVAVIASLACQLWIHRPRTPSDTEFVPGLSQLGGNAVGMIVEDVSPGAVWGETPITAKLGEKSAFGIADDDWQGFEHAHSWNMGRKI